MQTNFQQALGLFGKKIIITGGRTGLGFAMAQCVADAGGFPIILSSSPEDILQQAISRLPVGCGYHFDVTETDRAKSFIDRVLNEHGHIDALINNAGVHCKKPFEQTDIADYRRLLDVHLLGSVALTQAVVPAMRRQKSGSILFISSMSAMLGMTQVTAYAAAKSALLGMVKSLTGELSPDGIRVNAISPGFIDTPMFHQAVDADIPRQKKILGHTPMNAYGDPMDIGWAAVYFCSDASRFVTGVNLPVDGGCSIGF